MPHLDEVFGEFITLPKSQAASKVAPDFIFGLFFKLREGSSVSDSPSVLGQWKLRAWVVNQQCFSQRVKALIITGRALFQNPPL